MKMILSLALITAMSVAAQANTSDGRASVTVLSNGGFISIEGNAANALYDGMIDIPITPIEDGAFKGFLKGGTNYGCMRIAKTKTWKTSCIVQVIDMRNGVVGSEK